MMLQGTTRIEDVPEAAAERVSRAVDELDETIKEIRQTIFALHEPVDGPSSSARGRVLRETSQSAALLGFEPSVRFVGPVDSVLDSETTDHIVAVLREALASYLAGLDDSALGLWCTAELAARTGLFAGARVELRHRGVSEPSLREMEILLGAAVELRLVADPGLKRRGIVVSEGEGRLLVTLTEAQIEGILLGGKRGELAAALLPPVGEGSPVEAAKP